MSDKFQVGHTYKFNPIMILGMQALMQCKYSGEKGVFKVEEVDADGFVFTDDITSPVTTARCKIPANIIKDVLEVADASGATN